MARGYGPFETGLKSPPMPADIRAARLPSRLGSPSDAPRPQPQALLFPWWERPTTNSLDFSTQQVRTVLAAGANNTALLTTFTVPAGSWWVLRGVNLFVDSPLTTFNVQWIVSFNGSPLFAPIQFAGRNLSSLEVPFSYALRRKVPGALTVTAVNQDGAGPWTVAASVSGWITPYVEALAMLSATPGSE